MSVAIVFATNFVRKGREFALLKSAFKPSEIKDLEQIPAKFCQFQEGPPEFGWDLLQILDFRRLEGRFQEGEFATLPDKIGHENNGYGHSHIYIYTYIIV